VPKADIASHTPHSIHRLRLRKFPFPVQNLSVRTIEPHHGNSIPPQRAGSWKSCRRSRRAGRRLSCHRALLVRRGALTAAKPHRCAAPGKAITHRWWPVRSGQRRQLRPRADETCRVIGQAMSRARARKRWRSAWCSGNESQNSGSNERTKSDLVDWDRNSHTGDMSASRVEGVLPHSASVGPSEPGSTAQHLLP
jgi:hypothetical protein